MPSDMLTKVRVYRYSCELFAGHLCTSVGRLFLIKVSQCSSLICVVLELLESYFQGSDVPFDY